MDESISTNDDLFSHRFPRKCKKEDDVKERQDVRLRISWGRCKISQQKECYQCRAQIFTQRRFGGMRAHFRPPAGGINVPLTRYETSRRSGSVAGWRQYWNAASFPLLSISANLPPCSSSRGFCGALHLPVPFKARNELAPISKARERRSRDEGTPSLAKAKFDLLLIIRTATLKKFNRLPAIFEDEFGYKFDEHFREIETPS